MNMMQAGERLDKDRISGTQCPDKVLSAPPTGKPDVASFSIIDRRSKSRKEARRSTPKLIGQWELGGSNHSVNLP